MEEENESDVLSLTKVSSHKAFQSNPAQSWGGGFKAQRRGKSAFLPDLRTSCAALYAHSDRLSPAPPLHCELGNGWHC